MPDKPETPDNQETEDYRLKLRNLRLDDYPDVKRIMDQVYSGMGGAWTRRQFAAMLNRFPEGQICVEDNGTVAGAGVDVDCRLPSLWRQTHLRSDHRRRLSSPPMTPTATCSTAWMCSCDPEYRDMRLGRRLYDARKELCGKLNLRAIIAGGRIPGYKDYADELTPEQVHRPGAPPGDLRPDPLLSAGERLPRPPHHPRLHPRRQRIARLTPRWCSGTTSSTRTRRSR